MSAVDDIYQLIPEAQVAHLLYTLHADYLLANRVGVYAARGLLKQYVRRVPEGQGP